MNTTTSSQNFDQIEVMQNLLEEIIQIQKENKNTDEDMQRVQEIIKESNKAIENSTSPNEMIVDARILHTGTQYVNTNVTSLDTNLTSFNEEIYRNGVMAFIQNSSELRDTDKEWECFAPVTYHMFRKSNPVTFMLGPLTLEPPPVKEKTKTERHKKTAESEKKVLESVKEKENSSESESDVYDHILKWLVRKYKKNDKKPVNYFSFIIDPTDYWRTIENVFHFSFLVRDGSAKMSIQKGLPHVEPVLKNPENISTKKSSNNQFSLTLSIPQWKECIERFQVEAPSIPPFVKKS